MARVTNTSRLLSFVPLLFLLTGCVPMRYLEYTGNDTSYFGNWPQGSGTMAETSYDLPVYRGWPERPYRVLGSLAFEDPYKEWDQGILRAAVAQARKRKADAIVIRKGAEWGVGKISGVENSVTVHSFQTTALVIRWLTEAEIKERDRLLEDLLTRLSSLDRLVSPNRALAQHVYALLLQERVDPASLEGFERFRGIMQRLVAPDSDNLAGEWIFVSRLSSSTAISQGDEKILRGLARISTDGENITMLSNAGDVELNFNGTTAKGRLAGQLGLGGVTASSEGVATSDKISISFQSRGPYGIIRGNVVLQRLLQTNSQNEKANSPNRARTRT